MAWISGKRLQPDWLGASMKTAMNISCPSEGRLARSMCFTGEQYGCTGRVSDGKKSSAAGVFCHSTVSLISTATPMTTWEQRIPVSSDRLSDFRHECTYFPIGEIHVCYGAVASSACDTAPLCSDCVQSRCTSILGVRQRQLHTHSSWSPSTRREEY